LASLPHLAPQVARADGCNLLQKCADSFVGLTEVAEDEGEDSAKFVEALFDGADSVLWRVVPFAVSFPGCLALR
jgi:hypothetical protein